MLTGKRRQGLATCKGCDCMVDDGQQQHHGKAKARNEWMLNATSLSARPTPCDFLSEDDRYAILYLKYILSKLTGELEYDQIEAMVAATADATLKSQDDDSQEILANVNRLYLAIGVERRSGVCMVWALMFRLCTQTHSVALPLHAGQLR
ncbi:hypothetical protein GH714_014635 [Hevea brasiliensis]|uniref:Uncharacterized protein n=1 Tax=Hevea brasiliensis TaxID=3981 RepID=A0A6A6K4L6_HEVBR|nr:hypothetical protein GH714_014635 [Hevea brasiliensis]